MDEKLDPRAQGRDLYMTLSRKYFGDRVFYKKVLAVSVPIIIQNGITNFVNMLDNVMVGRVGTTQMTGVAVTNQLIFVFNLCIFGAISCQIIPALSKIRHYIFALIVSKNRRIIMSSTRRMHITVFRFENTFARPYLAHLT